MKEHSALYKWFWFRPVFRRLRPRLMTMILALVFPVSLVCLAFSTVSIYKSREAVNSMNQNAFSFYLDQVALRQELGDIDILSDFPASLAPSLTLLHWNAPQNGVRVDNEGSVYVSRDGEEAFRIFRDGTWREEERSFASLKRERNSFLWEKEGQPFRVLVTFPYDFSLRNVPAWFWAALGIALLTILVPILVLRRREKKAVRNSEFGVRK